LFRKKVTLASTVIIKPSLMEELKELPEKELLASEYELDTNSIFRQHIKKLFMPIETILKKKYL
jgi:hypothetical protein